MYPDLWQTTFFSLLPFPWSIHTYGLCIAVGFLLAVQLCKQAAWREGKDGEVMVDVTFYVLLWGLVGGRLMYMATQWRAFVDDPLELLRLWRGGLVWYGGFFGAMAYLWRFSRTHQWSFWHLVDLMIAPMALAHAFGRLGCLFAGCCFGRPTTLPWGIVFPAHSIPQVEQSLAHLVAPLAPSLPVHPTQLYEASAEFGLFLLLSALRVHKRYHGHLFLVWLGAYPVLRSTIEMFRGDKERGVMVLSTSQYLSIAVGLTAVALFFFFKKRLAVR